MGVIGQTKGGTRRIGVRHGGAQLPEQLAAGRIGPVEGTNGDQPLHHLFAQTHSRHEVADARIWTDVALALQRLAGFLVDSLDLAHSQPQGVRARIGLHVMANFMKIGLDFENVLKRGLLEFAMTLPNGAPEFRYAYHEVIEEAQHSLMFQEFVNRTGFDLPGLPPLLRFGTRRVIRLARRFPELFFVFVLGGEDPIDHVQRVTLATRKDLHPLLRRIIQIHVTEEARHVAFARSWLAEHVPSLSPARKRALALLAPVVLGIMARLILTPGRHLVREYGIPPELVRRAPLARARIIESVAKIREVLDNLGLVEAGLWRRMGVA